MHEGTTCFQPITKDGGSADLYTDSLYFTECYTHQLSLVFSSCLYYIPPCISHSKRKPLVFILRAETIMFPPFLSELQRCMSPPGVRWGKNI